MRGFKKSQGWLERAKKVIPFPYNQTFSKGPAQYVEGMSPVFADSGHGCYLYDVDGNGYIDLVMGLMPLILGYQNMKPWERFSLNPLPIYSLPHPFEVELSELLCEVIPCAEMVRLGKNGSDVTTAAVRLARAVTGRNKVACCGYHGWHDWYVGTTGRNRGVPGIVASLTKPFEYNNLNQLRAILESGDVACVIMEPVNFVAPMFMNTQDGFSNQMGGSFLNCVRNLCDKHKVILIFDEMITGFRWSLGGAQEYFDVIPDLACFGKAMANGWSISALVGKKDLMREFKNIHFSTTFGGEVMSIAAAISIIRFIQQEDVVEHLWKMGYKLKKGLKEMFRAPGVVHLNLKRWIKVEGYDVWPRLKCENNIIKSYISQELVAKGILWMDTFNLSYAHKARHVDKVLVAFGEIFTKLDGMELEQVERELRGKPIQARTVREGYGKNRRT